MKLFGFRRKPEWQHADPQRRLAAVETLQDPALKTALPELAQTDPDPAVRIAALARIDDLAVLERRMRGEHEPSVAQAAKQRLIQRLCASDIELGAALEALRQVHDETVLGEVAEHAAAAPLRRLALERSQRSNLKLQRCMHDADPELRLWLLSEIDDADALQRIADSVRKKDKRLARAARDKLDALRIAAGDPAALEARALSLAEQAGRLARELPSDGGRQLQSLQQEWQALNSRLGETTQRRVQGAIDTADLALRAARGEWTAPAPAVAAPTVDPLQAARDRLAQWQAALPTSDQPEFDARLQALQTDLAAFKSELSAAEVEALQPELTRLAEGIEQLQQQRREQHKAQRSAARQAEREARERQLEQALTTVEQALKAGQAQAAQEAWQALAKPGELPGPLRRRWQACQQGLHELTEAQRWASRQARQRLCEDADALHGSGLHPDAVASRVKELQAEWARLDQIDGDQAPPSDAGISRRFRAICHHALSPAKAYFEKRRELRGERAQAVEQMLAAAPSPEADVAALLQRQKALRDGLNQLRDVAAAQRNELAAQIRAELDAIHATLNQQREQALQAKRKLLAKLKRDLGAVDNEAGIRLAKAAQSEWRQLPRGRRQDEDTLWKELRELIDPLFAGLRERQDAEQAERQQLEQEASQILEELEALAKDDERLLHADAHMESLRLRWRELSRPPLSDTRSDTRGEAPSRQRAPAALLDERRFDRACATVQQAQTQRQRQRELEQLDTLCLAGDWLAEHRASSTPDIEALQARLAELDLPSNARAQLEAGLNNPPAADTPAALLAVRAELAAGLESAAADQGLRRQEQMQRLARKLEGSVQIEPADEVLACLIELQCRSDLDTPQRTELNQRIKSAFLKIRAD